MFNLHDQDKRWEFQNDQYELIVFWNHSLANSITKNKQKEN
jgi:hypothetical protein